MGGQTALNVSLEIASSGFLEKNNVELIGANKEAISKAENREEFRVAMNSIGLETPKSFIAHTLEEANSKIDSIGLPAIIRPSFTLGGTGGGIAYNVEEFNQIVGDGLKAELCGLARTNKKDIDAAVDCGLNYIHTFIATSDIHLEHKLKMSRDEALEKAIEAVEYGKSRGLQVEFSAEDAEMHQ